MAQQVTCINKRGDRYDPHERISQIGGSGWKVTQAQGIADVKADSSAYVVSSGTGALYLIVRQHNGNDCLTTEADGSTQNPFLPAGVPVTFALTHLDSCKQAT